MFRCKFLVIEILYIVIYSLQLRGLSDQRPIEVKPSKPLALGSIVNVTDDCCDFRMISSPKNVILD